MSKSLRMAAAANELNTLDEDDEVSINANEFIDSIKNFPHSRATDGNSTANSENIYPQKILSTHINTGSTTQMSSSTKKDRSQSASTVSTRYIYI